MADQDPEDPEGPQDPLSRYFEAAMGLTDLTRKRAERLVRNLVEQGQEAGNPRELVENLLARSNENRGTLAALIRGETERAMKAMGLATSNDVERLEQQVRALRRQLADAQEQAGTSEAQERAKRTAAEETAKHAGEEPTETASEGSSKKKTEKKSNGKRTKKSSS